MTDLSIDSSGEPLRQFNERWKLIKGLLSRWHRVTVDWQEDEFHEVLRSIEDQVGVTLPTGIKQWVQFIHTLEQTQQWIFRDSKGFIFLKENDALTLLVQGENDYYWGVKRSDLHLADPPVYGYREDFENPQRVFLWDMKVSDTVSAFALKYILDYHYMFKSLGGYTSDVNHEEALTMLRKEVSNVTQIEDYYLLELPGIIAILNENQLSVAYRVDPIQLPDSLKEYSKKKSSYNGKQYEL